MTIRVPDAEGSDGISNPLTLVSTLTEIVTALEGLGATGTVDGGTP